MCAGLLLVVVVECANPGDEEIKGRVQDLRGAIQPLPTASIPEFCMVQNGHVEAWWPRVEKARRLLRQGVEPQQLRQQLVKELFVEGRQEVSMRQALEVLRKAMSEFAAAA